MHVFVVYIIVCNKNFKTLKYRRNDFCVFVFIKLIYFNIGYEISHLKWHFYHFKNDVIIILNF